MDPSPKHSWGKVVYGLISVWVALFLVAVYAPSPDQPFDTDLYRQGSLSLGLINPTCSIQRYSNLPDMYDDLFPKYVFCYDTFHWTFNYRELIRDTEYIPWFVPICYAAN
jgi:hypothetical protein